MGQCGCYEGNQAYRIKAPNGWYVIELLPGCNYCDHGPGLSICHPEAMDHLEGGDILCLPELPWCGPGEFKLATFKCGLSPTESGEAAVKCFVSEDCECKIDEDLADILGEDFWKEYLDKSPSLVEVKNEV